MSLPANAGAGRPPRRIGRRLAFCPVCGGEQRDKPASEVGRPEDALCPGQCVAAWHVLLALRVCESTSELVADRRRVEWEAKTPPAPVLSELLLGRWRSGDWSVAPEDVSSRLARPA